MKDCISFLIGWILGVLITKWLISTKNLRCFIGIHYYKKLIAIHLEHPFTGKVCQVCEHYEKKF